MPEKFASVLRTSILTGVLAGCLCGLALVSSARAQGEGGSPAAPAGAKQEQQPSLEELSKEKPLRVTSNIVTAPVTVFNSDGEFVFDLQPKDFEILDNGVPQHIEQFSLEMHPL